ncbi:sentrin-specific protease 2 [Anolis sagrei]|uniref:sentrin-specific protease 2 n=1 Tax=Anolis sagrei TaxID=38937 RepID=UPI0035215407
MQQWLPEALRWWFSPRPTCRREAPPARPRKRRIQSNPEDFEHEQIKRQKLGIFGMLARGIANLITLPSQLASKYLQTEEQHAEAKDEFFSNVSNGTFSDKQMEPTTGKQMLDKKTGCGTSMHPDVEVLSDYHRVMPCLRYDCNAGKNSKKRHSSFQEELLPWGLATHRHKVEGSALDAGRYLRKPHYTVEEAKLRVACRDLSPTFLLNSPMSCLKPQFVEMEGWWHESQGVQNEEREKYKKLLEQEKEKRSKNNSSPSLAKHLHLTTERSSEPDKIMVRKKECIMHPLANELSEEVSLKLNLGQEGSSDRRRCLVKMKEQKYLSFDKTTEYFPDLTEPMEREIANVLSYGKEDQVLTSAFKLNITRGDIQTLRNQQWLNDVVINFYMNLLVERNKRQGFPLLYAFSTFFYPKLSSAGYNAVRRWTKEVDLFQHDLILVPIHIRVHWALVVIDMRRETIKYFDSMGQSGHNICMKLLQYLQDESKVKRNLEINPSSWTLYSMKPNEIPQQRNGSDCGVFVCKYADFISRDKPIVFSQCHMPYYRKRMVWEILHQQLL